METNVQDRSPHMSFILKGSQISALWFNDCFKFKTSILEYRNEIQNPYQTCAWIVWYKFSLECEELRNNHLTPLLVTTMPYACWFLWQTYYIEDFKWRLHFQFEVAFWRVVLREVYFEGPNCVWMALKTSILNTDGNTRMDLDRLCPKKSLKHWPGGQGGKKTGLVIKWASSVRDSWGSLAGFMGSLNYCIHDTTCK